MALLKAVFTTSMATWHDAKSAKMMFVNLASISWAKRDTAAKCTRLDAHLLLVRRALAIFHHFTASNAATNEPVWACMSQVVCQHVPFHVRATPLFATARDVLALDDANSAPGALVFCKLAVFHYLPATQTTSDSTVRTLVRLVRSDVYLLH